MKKITNLLYVLAVLMLVSCNDFLDKSPKYAVDPETTVTDDVAVALTNACYKALHRILTVRNDLLISLIQRSACYCSRFTRIISLKQP